MKKIFYFMSVALICLVALCFSASAAHQHSYKTTVTAKATFSESGKTVKKCSCGKVKSKSSKKVYRVKSVTLSEKKYTYNGKEKKPSVTVKDTKGNTLKKGTDYTVKYESGRTLPGKYNVKITLKGKYSGVKKVTFTIAPKTTSKVTYTTTTDSITLKWSKVTGASGYAVFQYKSGEWKRIKTITSPDTVKFTLKNLKAGQTVKFRIKAFKKDDGTIWGKATGTVTVTTDKVPYVAMTSGGVKLYPITSAEAKVIHDKWGSYYRDYYEGKAENGTTLIYTYAGGKWYGQDLYGARYDEYGKKCYCPYCGSVTGSGKDMCDGSCAVSFG